MSNITTPYVTETFRGNTWQEMIALMVAEIKPDIKSTGKGGKGNGRE